MLVSTGVGFVTASTATFDVPPPGSGFSTVTFTLPATMFEGTMNVSVPSSTNAVTAFPPFTCTCELCRNPFPWIVTGSVRRVCIVDGSSQVMTATGLMI